jgi:hypothetical protein
MNANYVEMAVETNPTSDIYIDGLKVGFGTFKNRVLAGVHSVEARLDHYHSDIQKIESTVGNPQTISLAPRPKLGKLSVVTSPYDATIILNGKEYGTTPNTLNDLLEGTYTLALSKPTFETITKTITISEGQKTEISETLELANVPKHNVLFVSVPSGASVFLNGEQKTKTDNSLLVSEGEYKLRIEKDGYHPHETLLRVNANTQLPKVVLKRILKKYTFTVNSSPVGANLYVDDKLRGKTPIEITEEEGEHRIKISLDTYSDQYQNITLDKNLGLIEFKLRPADLDKRMARYRTQSYVWLGAALVTTAGGFVFRSKANSNYSMYQSATNSDEATGLHNTITSQDKIAVACWASAVVCTVPLIIYRLKLSKLHKQFNFAAIPVQGGAVIGFSANF